MKNKRIMAILLSAIIAFSLCAPMSGISGYAAENEEVLSEESVEHEEEQVSLESIEEAVEAEKQEDIDVQEIMDSPEAVLEEEIPAEQEVIEIPEDGQELESESEAEEESVEAAEEEESIVAVTEESAAEEEESTYIIEPTEGEVEREAVSDSSTNKNYAQGIFTEADTTLTLYYGPLISVGDVFRGNTVTNIENCSIDSPSYQNSLFLLFYSGHPSVTESVTRVVFDSSFKAVKPISTSSWFSDYKKLTSLDFSGLDTSNVTNMSGMFLGCTSLESLDLRGFDTSNVTNMWGMFDGCKNLKSLNMSGLDLSRVKDMDYMFKYCESLISLDFSGLNTSNATTMWGMFDSCDSLESLDLSGFKTSKVTNMSWMFSDCKSLKSLDLSGFDTSKVNTMCNMFANCTSLTSLNISGFDTSNVTNMIAMFDGCENLTSLDVSGFNTSKVTDMNHMFSNCKSIKNLDLDGFDTTNVTDMWSMFGGCENLNKLDLSKFHTPNVTNMMHMFWHCYSLTDLDVSGFDTSNVTDMREMFFVCTSLTSLDLSGFNTSNVETTWQMFAKCENLMTLDLSGFDLSGANDTSSMFGSCQKLNTIYCKDSTTDWKCSGKTTYMFSGCYRLVGKDGAHKVVYSGKKADGSMAKAAGLGGYFTPIGSVRDISSLNVRLSSTSVAYTGSEQTPTVVVTDGSQKLVENEDFEVQYDNNTRIGTSNVIIRGIGGYKGTVTKTFKIVLGKTTRGDVFNLANNVKVTWKEVPGAKYYKVYREGVTDPKESRKDPVIVTDRPIGWDKDPGLTNGHAYRYKIVASLSGKGDSSGDSTLSYSKLMYRLKTVVIRSVKNTAPGKVTVKYDKTTSGDSYVLQYSERQDMAGAKTKVVLGADNTSYVIGGLKKGKTYYISIRVRKKVNGIDYYTTFGVPKRVVITQ